MPGPVKYDLVLSSGFLAFANHCGFLQAGAHACAALHCGAAHRAGRLPLSCLQLPPANTQQLAAFFLRSVHLAAAVEDVGLPINGIMGTSAGALIGSFYAAGYSPREVSAQGNAHGPALGGLP